MKKRFVSILLVAAMTASLAACGGSNGCEFPYKSRVMAT